MPTPYDKAEYLDRKECAIYLSDKGFKISAKTLANIAANRNAGDGPPFHRVRWTRVFYKRTEVDAWAAERTEKVE